MLLLALLFATQDPVPPAEPAVVATPPAPARTPGEMSRRVEFARRIAVAQFRADGVDPVLAEQIPDILALEIEKFAGVDVVARSDLRGLLGQLAENQLLGCEDPGCFVDLDRVLPARRLLTGSVSNIGGALYVQAALIDLAEGRVVARAGAPLGTDIDDVAAGLRTIALGLVTGDPLLLGDDTTVKGEVTADMLERVRIAQRPRGLAFRAHGGGVFSASFAFGNPTDPAYPGGAGKLAVDVPVHSWVSVTPSLAASYYVGRFVNQATFSFSDEEETLGFKDTDGAFVADYGMFDANVGLAIEVQAPTGLVRPYLFAGASLDWLVLDTSDLAFQPDEGEAPLPPPFGDPIPFEQSLAPGGGAVVGLGVDFNISEHTGVSLELSAYGKLHALERVSLAGAVEQRTPVLPLTGVLLTIGGFYEL